MKPNQVTIQWSGLLLVLSGQATAQTGTRLEVSQIQKITDPSQGGFRPFMEFSVSGQVMRGLLDTGSSDLNIPKTGSSFCRSDGQQCDGQATGFKAGSFDPDRNGTQIRDLQLPLNATFTGGAAFIGRFIEGPLQVSPGGRAVPMQMGLVESGGVPRGQVSFPVIGVGPIQGEATDKQYPNIPARFKQENLTKANAFGLYLGDFRSPNNGTLVWGGFDAAKFEGELKETPLAKTQDGVIPSFVVDLSSVSVGAAKNGGQVGNGEGCQRRQNRSQAEVLTRGPVSEEFRPSKFTKRHLDAALRPSYEHKRQTLSSRDVLRRQRNGNLLTNDAPPVVWLDTGVPEIVLPAGTMNALAGRLGAEMGPQGEFLVDCGRITGMELTIGMNKDAVQVKVPLDSIIAAPSSAPVKGGARTGNNSGQPGPCQLALSAVQGNGPTDIPILGAPAMQHMYVVFDMDSKALMIAQAKVNETKTDVREYVPRGSK